jgi:hypothetical protein
VAAALQWPAEINVNGGFRLRQLGWFGRLGVAGVVLTLLGGLAASAAYVHMFHGKRDGRAGLSMTDLMGSYHGIDAPAPLLRSLEEGHPDELPAHERAALIEWLRGGRVAQLYDSIDLGEMAPAELIADRCLTCHARRAADEHAIARTIPLDYWDDVSRMAFAMKIDPPPMEILVLTTHTHALSLATISGMTMLLLVFTSWPRRVVGALIGVAGLALLVDVGAWWLARVHAGFVYAIAAAGVTYLAVTAAAQLAILADLFGRSTNGLGRIRTDV